MNSCVLISYWHILLSLLLHCGFLLHFDTCQAMDNRKLWFHFRDEHPIIPVIKEHRTLAKLLNCTLGSICSLGRLSVKTQKYTLHGHWLQTSTATGRLSMEEPNLQVWVSQVILFSPPVVNNLNSTVIMKCYILFFLIYVVC